MSFARPILLQGVLFALINIVLMLAWDWADGSLTPWPQAALRYPVLAIVGGAAYGLLMGRFDRRTRSA